MYWPTVIIQLFKDQNEDEDEEVAIAINQWYNRAANLLQDKSDSDKQVIDNLLRGNINLILANLPWPSKDITHGRQNRFTEMTIKVKHPIVNITFIVQRFLKKCISNQDLM